MDPLPGADDGCWEPLTGAQQLAWLQLFVGKRAVYPLPVGPLLHHKATSCGLSTTVDQTQAHLSRGSLPPTPHTHVGTGRRATVPSGDVMLYAGAGE